MPQKYEYKVLPTLPKNEPYRWEISQGGYTGYSCLKLAKPTESEVRK